MEPIIDNIRTFSALNGEIGEMLAAANLKPHEGGVFEGGKLAIRVCSKWAVFTVQRMQKMQIRGWRGTEAWRLGGTEERGGRGRGFRQD